MKVKEISFFASFKTNTPLYKIDEFVNKYRLETDNNYEFYVDVKLSQDGHKVFISNSKDDFILELG